MKLISDFENFIDSAAWTIRWLLLTNRSKNKTYVWQFHAWNPSFIIFALNRPVVDPQNVPPVEDRSHVESGRIFDDDRFQIEIDPIPSGDSEERDVVLVEALLCDDEDVVVEPEVLVRLLQVESWTCGGERAKETRPETD